MHTPGPWVVECDDAMPPGKRKRRQPPPTMLMVVAAKGGMPGILVNQGPVEPRDYANGRLVAAAPDLLEALKTLMECEAHFDDDAPQLIAARNQASAAIAKAEGDAL